MTSHIPTYGNVRSFVNIEPLKSFSRGDSSASYKVQFENHWGTHIDAPAHFFQQGKKVSEFQAEYWISNNPQVIELKLKPGELVMPSHLANKKIHPKTDCLILKSGWHRKRGSADYSFKNPGIHASTGIYLRQKFKKLRMIGFDWVSLSSRLHRDEGREAHRAFLRPSTPQSGNSICILEDMDLSKTTFKIKQIIVAPLRIVAIDSAPCTVFGIFND